MEVHGQSPADRSAPSPSLPPQRPSVLVVEDDHATHTAMRMLLEHYEFDVLHARTVADAVAVVDRANPQYLFLDLMLPDGDGIGVLEHIRRRNLPTAVIVITGSNDPARLRRVQDLQPKMLLRKPLDFLALLSQITTKPPNR